MACTYTLRMCRFANEHDAFRLVYPTLGLWYHNIRLTRHRTRLVEQETQPGWGQGRN